jgi:hypothetical protein
MSLGSPTMCVLIVPVSSCMQDLDRCTDKNAPFKEADVEVLKKARMGAFPQGRELSCYVVRIRVTPAVLANRCRSCQRNSHPTFGTFTFGFLATPASQVAGNGSARTLVQPCSSDIRGHHPQSGHHKHQCDRFSSIGQFSDISPGSVQLDEQRSPVTNPVRTPTYDFRAVDFLRDYPLQN